MESCPNSRSVVAIAVLALMAAAAGDGRAQTQDTASPVQLAASGDGSSARFMDQFDSVDVVDVSDKALTVEEVVSGLFPEKTESLEKRKERERCERLVAKGFICMAPKRSYKTFSLPFANFEVGSSSLPDKAKATLRVFAEAFQGWPASSPVVRIDGHADASGSPELNQALSQKRANAVRDYLVSQGVGRGILTAQGFGAHSLLNPSDPFGAENRRVVIARNLAK